MLGTDGAGGWSALRPRFDAIVLPGFAGKVRPNMTRKTTLKVTTGAAVAGLWSVPVSAGISFTAGRPVGIGRRRRARHMRIRVWRPSRRNS